MFDQIKFVCIVYLPQTQVTRLSLNSHLQVSSVASSVVLNKL